MKMREWIGAAAGLLVSASVSHAAYFQGQTYLPSAPARTQVSLTTYGGVCDGVTDDTAAFIAFKTAWQGTTPVQLNLPTGTCLFTPSGGGSSFGFTPFRGISNLIVAGQGQVSTTLKNPAGTSLFLGGLGQRQSNDYSVRTNDAAPGDSCVVLKTAPSLTVSNVTNNLAVPASFTGSISGTTLTASSVTGTIAVGALLNNQNTNVAYPTTIVTQLTGSAGGAGTYTVSISQTVASQTFSTAPASFTISGVTAAGVMTVSSVEDGTISVGAFLFDNSGTSSLSFRAIKSQLTGAAGGTGTYQLDAGPAAAIVSSRPVWTNGQVRVTVNSTSGITTGDNVWFTGVSGFGVLPQRVNGLRWVKVINGTQLDIFLSDFGGKYSSGGTGGGDRTSLFANGSTVLMAGWNNQQYWAFPYGFPSNPGYFEYKKVVSSNSGTHQVCFDSPLALTYKASWPQMNTGNQFEVDPGGPATLYSYDSTWEATLEFKDFTLDVTAQTYANARTVTFRDITMLGSNCVAPTQNETHNWINVTGTNCQIETDKIVQNWNVTNVSLRKVDIQSSSFVNVNVNGVTSSNGWFGSGKKLNMQNATITGNLNFGVTAYGSSEETICSNCTSDVTGFLGGAAQRVDDVRTPWSMASGIITIPNAYSLLEATFEYQLRNLMVGQYVLWSGAGGGGANAQFGRVFKIVSVTQDVDNTYLQTSEAGGFPTGTWTTNGLSVQPHPAPKLTTSGMAGNNNALALNGCPAQSPMFSCQNFTYTGGASGTTPGFKPLLIGEMSSFTFTNNVPYTNTGSLTWQISQFNNWPVLKTDLTQVSYGASPNGQAIVNTKLPSSCGSCTRTLTPPATVTNGQTGDTITATPTGAWFGGQASSGPIFSANTPSDSPQVTIQLRTNQNLP